MESDEAEALACTLDHAVSSSSAELLATTDWAFAQTFMQCPPTIATPPDVDFRLWRQLAQPASMKTPCGQQPPGGQTSTPAEATS